MEDFDLEYGGILTLCLPFAMMILACVASPVTMVEHTKSGTVSGFEIQPVQATMIKKFESS